MHPNSSRAALVGLFISLISLSAAEEILLRESFETDGDDSRYILIGGYDDGDDNYVARRQVEPSPIPESPVDGEWIFGFQDIDFAPIESRAHGDLYEAEELGVRDARIKFEGIDVAGFGNLRVVMAAANFGGGNEPDDDLYLRVRFDDGDWIEIGGFKSPGSNMHPAYYNGPRPPLVAAGDSVSLLPTFEVWDWPITGHGSAMELQITVSGNAGNEDHHIDNVMVIGDSALAFVTSNFANAEITEPESGGISNALTLLLESPAPEGGVTFDLQPSNALSASSLALPSEPVTIAAGENSVEVPVEVVQDGRFTGTKIVELYVRAEGYNAALARVQVGNVSPRPNVLITEVLTAVPGVDSADLIGDANRDGVRHNNEDRFVEIMNFEDHPIDISGWTIWEETFDHHLFPDDTLLQSKQAAVVFVGGAPTGGFGGAIVMTKSSGPTVPIVNLASYSPTFFLRAPFGGEVDRIDDLPQRADFLLISEDPSRVPEDHAGHGLSASVHRLVRGSAEPGTVLDVPDHMHSLIDGSEERLFSPGTWFDGTVSTGNGWTRLPIVFTGILHHAGGGWFWDFTFGWLYSGAPDWDLPWVYLAIEEGYWYVHEASVSESGMWVYDHALGSWCYTGYTIYPWVWQDSASGWVNRASHPQ